MKLLDNLRSRPAPTVERHYGGGWSDFVTFQGQQYLLGGSNPDMSDGQFVSNVRKVHEQSGVVSAAVFTRSLLLSQIRFAHKPLGEAVNVNTVAHGDTQSLARLERPGGPHGQGMTRPTMLMRMEQDASYAGNTFLVPHTQNRLLRLEPHRVKFVLGSDSMPDWDDHGKVMLPYDAQVLGITYNPNNNQMDTRNIVAFLPHEYCHWAPEPDPLQWWRGASWVASMLQDVALEGQIDDHQAKFFQNAATPRVIFIADGTKTADEVKAHSKAVNQKYAGTDNAYKNMFIGGVTDVRVVGTDFDKIGFQGLQGTIEIRTAMRSRIPPVILGTRDSLSGSSLNAGNYGSARRMLADGWFSPTVENMCASLECLAPPPPGQMLGADLSHVLFLQEDQKDKAEIDQATATTISTLVTAGYQPDSVIATIAPKWSGLKHTDLFSVQLQPAGTEAKKPNAPSDT